MIAWLNLIVLIIATKLLLYFYVLSVSPVRLERRIGERAWRRCTIYRLMAGGFEFVIMANYVVYVFYPLPIGLQERFPWPWWVSIVVGLVIVRLPARFHRHVLGRGARPAHPVW